jgi:hypothetical protein
MKATERLPKAVDRRETVAKGKRNGSRLWNNLLHVKRRGEQGYLKKNEDAGKDEAKFGKVGIRRRR